MTILNLGVLDTPYRHGPSRTVFDVAKILEAKYGIMGFFYDRHAPEISLSLAQSYANTAEAVMKGAPYTPPAAGGLSKVEALFKSMLATQEMDGKIRGVPTAAALHGVSHRFKHPYKRRPPRPSFIDTGLYQASFKAWVTDK